MSSFAWATLVMRSELYACGALVLGASLRRAGTTADLICMVTDDIPADVAEALGEVWDHVVEVPRVVALKGAHQRQQRRFGHMYAPWLNACLTKFAILAMGQYKKIAFLDADMLCVTPMFASQGAAQADVDVLFSIPAPAGILDLHRKDPKRNAELHGREIPRSEVKQSLISQCYAMRGCLLLLKPDPALFQEIQRVAEREPIGHVQAMAGPDEYFITKLYLERGPPWHHIHPRFGMISWVAAQLSGEPPVFLHYVSEKPWAAPGSQNDPSPGVSQNWEDFKHWDQVATEDVLPQLPEELVDRLFSGWKKRTALPRVPSFQ